METMSLPMLSMISFKVSLISEDRSFLIEYIEAKVSKLSLCCKNCRPIGTSWIWYRFKKKKYICIRNDMGCNAMVVRDIFHVSR